MTPRTSTVLAGLALALLLTFASVPSADAGGLADDGNASWRLEQPLPPELPDGQKATAPIGLGKISDIEFWAPNRGLLITAGNPPTIPPGLWAYNGVSWHELSTVCGATNGRIAWAGPDDFWTISDGRPGQTNVEDRSPPLADNTLCHFSGGQVVGSYASLAFLPGSYQAMQGAGCLGPEDCWFAGDPLPEGQVGAFQLHWDGHSLTAEPNPQGHAVEDLRRFGGELYEGVRIKSEDLLGEEESPSEPSDLHLIEPNGVQPRFVSLLPGVPIYSKGEFPEALDFPRLSADEGALWGAADPASAPEGSAAGQVTVLRYAGGVWSQLLGPTTDSGGENPFTKFIPKGTSPTPEEEQKESEDEAVSSIAAEPPSESETVAGEESAWLALSSGENSAEEPLAPALVARISSEGVVSERQTLPSEQETLEAVGPKGAAAKIACPAPHDCWLATTQGWLFHLALEGERQLPQDTDPAFSSLITYRPPDAGIPQVEPDAPPPDTSGLLGESPGYGGTFAEAKAPAVESKIQAPLLTDVHSRLLHGSTLELRFHLAVRAHVRLLAKRRRKLVASTPMRTLAAGNRKLLLRLNPHDWPTKLSLQTHALAPLPTTTVKEAVGGPEHGGGGSNTVSTGLSVLTHVPSFAELGPRP